MTGLSKSTFSGELPGTQSKSGKKKKHTPKHAKVVILPRINGKDYYGATAVWNATNQAAIELFNTFPYKKDGVTWNDLNFSARAKWYKTVEKAIRKYNETLGKDV